MKKLKISFQISYCTKNTFKPRMSQVKFKISFQSFYCIKNTIKPRMSQVVYSLLCNEPQHSFHLSHLFILPIPDVSPRTASTDCEKPMNRKNLKVRRLNEVEEGNSAKILLSHYRFYQKQYTFVHADFSNY